MRDDIVHFQDRIYTTLDQRQHRLTLTFAPIIAGVIGILHLGAVTMTWFHPLTREGHARIRFMLERKKELAIAKEAKEVV